MLTNIILLGMTITMAIVGYTSAYTVMKKQIVLRDIELHMAYTYIGDKLDARATKKRERRT